MKKQMEKEDKPKEKKYVNENSDKFLIKKFSREIKSAEQAITDDDDEN